MATEAPINLMAEAVMTFSLWPSPRLPTGGSGNDQFDYNFVFEIPTGGGSRDQILDFAGAGAAVGDVIDLHDLDAIPGGVDNPFAWIGCAAFFAQGQVRYTLAMDC